MLDCVFLSEIRIVLKVCTFKYLTSFCICQYSDGRSEFASGRLSGVSSSSSLSDELSLKLSSAFRGVFDFLKKSQKHFKDFNFQWQSIHCNINLHFTLSVPLHSLFHLVLEPICVSYKQTKIKNVD